MIFPISGDLKRSHGSFVFDRNAGKEFLDFHGLYATTALGYNHKIFGKNFLEEIENVVHTKIPITLLNTPEYEDFLSYFIGKVGKRYQHFWFSSTGSLAVEAAIKTALEHKRNYSPKIISLFNSYHGNYGYGGFVSYKSNKILDLRFDGAYRVNSIIHIYPPYQEDMLGDYEKHLKQQVEYYGKEKLVALVIEPIQSTAGDRYFPRDFWKINREFCDKYDIVLIHDEIQTGFWATGNEWYSDAVRANPDIIIFGKKSQVSGIMVKDRVGEIFDNPTEKLECTWNGDLVDMIRCKYILKAIEKFNLKRNVLNAEIILKRELMELNGLRGIGVMCAFDTPSGEKADKLREEAFNNGLLVNRGGISAIRLRPNLAISEEELLLGANILKKVYGGII